MKIDMFQISVSRFRGWVLGSPQKQEQQRRGEGLEFALDLKIRVLEMWICFVILKGAEVCRFLNWTRES